VLPAFVRRLTPRQAGRWISTALITLIVSVASQYPDFRGVFAGVVGGVSNRYLSWTSPLGSTEIATVAIDDDDYRRFFDARSPLDPVAVVGLVETLRALRPAVLGVDLLTEDDAYKDWPQGRAMKEAFTTQQRPDVSSVPVVWAASAQSSTEAVGFFGWLFGGQDEIVVIPGSVLGTAAREDRPDWGIPIFPLDDDRTVRRLPRSWLNRERDDIASTNTFARAVAWRYCRTRSCHDHEGADEVLLTFGRSSSLRTYSVRDLLECGESTLPVGASGTCRNWRLKVDATGRAWSNTILLIGGTFSASRDAYPSPAGESTPGLMLNALGIRAEIEGPTLVESSKLFGLVLDIVVGLIVGYLFKKPGKSLRWKTWASLLLIFPAFLLSVGLFFWLDMLWVTWVVMLVSSMAWNVVIENLSHHDHPSNTSGPVRKSTSILERTTVSDTEIQEGDTQSHT